MIVYNPYIIKSIIAYISIHISPALYSSYSVPVSTTIPLAYSNS